MRNIEVQHAAEFAILSGRAPQQGGVRVARDYDGSNTTGSSALPATAWKAR